MPSVDDLLRHAFDHADDEWARLTSAAHSAVSARHRRDRAVRRGLAASVVATAAAAVVAVSVGPLSEPRGVDPADPLPTSSTPSLASPLEGTWRSGPLQSSDVRAAAREAGTPTAAATMLAELPQSPFRVVVVMRGASLTTYVEGAGGRLDVVDQEAVAVEDQLLTVRPFDVQAESVHVWSLAGDELTLRLRSTTEPGTGEAWQRLLYNSVALTR